MFEEARYYDHQHGPQELEAIVYSVREVDLEVDLDVSTTHQDCCWLVALPPTLYPATLKRVANAMFSHLKDYDAKPWRKT